MADRRITLEATERDGHGAIAVSDAGMGIPPEDLPNVAKKFTRGRRAPGSGSGLGLSIASAIAQDHGGTMTLHSSVGSGTTVTVTLPLA